MAFKTSLVCLLLIATQTTLSFASIEGYFCPYSTKKFENIASKALKTEGDDLAAIYYGANTYKLLNQPVPQELKVKACEQLQKLFKPELEVDALFYGISSQKLLGCGGKLPTDAISKKVDDILQNDKSTVTNLWFATELLALLGRSVPNPAKVSQLAQAQLKADDNLLSLAYALHLASHLGSSGKFITERIEDIVVQADEVDGKLLQWEGGLSTTSLITTGLFKFPAANTLNQAQADKLANYLLSRATVQTPKGVSALLEATAALAASKLSPVSISIAGPASVSLDSPNLKVQVSDILGRTLKPAPGPVVAQSATRVADDVVVLVKQPLSAGTKETEFVLPLKLEPGYYKILLNAGTHSANLFARVLGPVEVKSFEIGVTDTDGSSAPKLEKVSYPNKLGKKLQGDSSQNLLVKFTLTRPVHQAFIRLSSGKKEIIFVAGHESNNQYKVEAELGQELTTSGTFNLELIIGDSVITNPFRWNVGELEVKIPNAPAVASPSKVLLRGPKPEIKHMFRQPDKRPAKAVSLLFTALTAAPFLVLLVLWAKIGANISNFTAKAVPFHLGFGAILALFTLFWLKLDMFTTCAWLIPIGGFTFFAGHKLLSHMARSKKSEK
ncbi:dolichyl-diphosphooligosaccharide--protein glycosyltransferase subunit 2 [Anthonomus grandis grandis]|uniref:dolichyl-diphosphooligosaccharide--protein glycosyltransferase subunit 2 n=1 Tax=Anthonomus grandis grandis TaxID=2921223 RepID=UPI00216686C1|nr:dolichyl-diphosphooligosaccharide--protein glycosyltransferase subunit 2 [Anthonomus grandis grandis]